MQEYTSSYSESGIRKAILKSYMWMALGLIITAGVSYVMYSTGLLLCILYAMPFLSFVIMFAQIALCFMMSSAMHSATSQKIKTYFIIYAITMGITMTSIGYTFDIGAIAIAFGISAFYFACLVFIGTTTKKNLTGLGTICMAALFALVISQIFMMLFRFPMNLRLYSIIGLLIFTGITAWDVQRMNQILVYNDGNVMEQEKIAIYFALELYLDFINIFLYILRLIGAGSDD